jgi:hypothetical protein
VLPHPRHARADASVKSVLLEIVVRYASNYMYSSTAIGVRYVLIQPSFLMLFGTAKGRSQSLGALTWLSRHGTKALCRGLRA